MGVMAPDRLGEAVLVCPECGKRRSTSETLRVHRWLAHDVRVGPPKVDR